MERGLLSRKKERGEPSRTIVPKSLLESCIIKRRSLPPELKGKTDSKKAHDDKKEDFAERGEKIKKLKKRGKGQVSLLLFTSVSRKGELRGQRST